MRVRVKPVISFHCRNMCAFSAVAWRFYVADTVAHLSAGTEGGMCSFTGRCHPLNATDYQKQRTYQKATSCSGSFDIKLAEYI